MAMMALGFCGMLLVVGVAEAVSLQAELQKKEEAVSRLARRAEVLHAVRDRALAECGGGKCAVSGCGERFGEEEGYVCSEMLGRDEATCGCKGKRLSNSSTVVLSATYSRGLEAQAFVCGGSGLDETFTANMQGARGLSAYQYVGHQTGVLRMFPGSPIQAGVCEDYDPRTRPWYAAAATGPKDVVVVFDISTSMDGPFSLFRRDVSRLDMTVRALGAFLKTFTHNDYVSVVGFARDAHVVGDVGHLLQGTKSNLDRLQPQVGWLQRQGGRDGTRFSVGLGKAFEVLAAKGTNEREAGTTSGCARLILFLTDGENEEAGVDLAGEIEGHQQRLEAAGGQRARILTYSMGSTALKGAGLLQKIACDHGGAWAPIKNGEDPRESLTRYYEFLSVGVDSTVVRWSTPYDDAFGLGTLTTAARGVYATRGGRRTLIGVAGADVRLQDLQELGGTSVVEELIQRSQECPLLNLTECQLARLRHELGEGLTCPGSTAPPECSAAPVDELSGKAIGMERILCDGLEPRRAAYADLVCCCFEGSDELGAGAIVGIAVGTVAFVVVVALVVWYVVRRRRLQNEAVHAPPKPSAPTHPF